MSGSEKKKRPRTQATKIVVSTYDISYIRCVTGTSQENVQENVQESVLHLQSFFLLIRTIAIFCRSRCRHRLALHDCICLFE